MCERDSVYVKRENIEIEPGREGVWRVHSF